MEGAAMFTGSTEAYDRFIGRYGSALAGAMLETAGITPGLRVLDVGCGTGALAARAAQIVGPENVAAVDPSQPFADACRARIPDADVRVATAEALPFGEAVFDAVLSQLVVNFLTDAPKGLAEMRRVAKPGGVVAACVWDYAGEMRLLRAFWDAAVAVDPDGAGPIAESHTMRYSNPEELGALWSEAGLEGVEVSPLHVEASYTDFDDLWTPFTAGIGPAGAYCASLDHARQDVLRERLRAVLGDPTGPFTLTARAWCAVGRS
jgi:ubiquinone/menaquinone biosynthesis C-methylase UbiE